MQSYLSAVGWFLHQDEIVIIWFEVMHITMAKELSTWESNLSACLSALPAH